VKGRYKVARLVEQLGADAKLTDWLASITKKKSIDMSDQCGARGDANMRIGCPRSSSAGTPPQRP
jgi:hypothetical protein